MQICSKEMVKFMKVSTIKFRSWMCIFGMIGLLGFFPGFNGHQNYIFFLGFSMLGFYWLGKIDMKKANEHPIKNKGKARLIIGGAFAILCALLLFLLTEEIIPREIILAVCCLGIALIGNIVFFLLYFYSKEKLYQFKS
jgi:hypothetical protein